MTMMKGIDVANPGTFITLIIGILIAVEMVKVGLPLILDGLVTLSGIGNFSFASFFAANGLMQLVVSAVILLGVLAVIGVKAGKSKR